MITTLAELPQTVARERPQSPALLLVGEVVRFYRVPHIQQTAPQQNAISLMAK